MGHIHLGHLVEYIQTDIWVRFQKLRGNRCIYHLRRRHARHGDHDPRPPGRPQRRSVDRRNAGEHHLRDFAGFDIEFDNYGSTQQRGKSRAVRRNLGGASRKPG